MAIRTLRSNIMISYNLSPSYTASQHSNHKSHILSLPTAGDCFCPITLTHLLTITFVLLLSELAFLNSLV